MHRAAEKYDVAKATCGSCASRGKNFPYLIAQRRKAQGCREEEKASLLDSICTEPQKRRKKIM